MTSGSNSAQSLLRELYLNKNGIALLVAVLVSLALLAGGANASGVTHTVVTGLGTSLLASAVFAALFLLFVSGTENRLLRATINGVSDRVVEQAAIQLRSAVGKQAEEMTDRVVAQVREQQQRYVPVDVYEERDNFSHRFNLDLTRDLERTSRYVYYGLTGKYVGARLLSIDHRISDVRVVIGDPRTPAAIFTRKRHEGLAQGNGEIRTALVKQVDQCIIGLFNARHRHEHISLYVTAAPNYDRVEITDTAAYLTLFTTQENRPNRYPETLRFSSDATFYQMMLRDGFRAANAPGVEPFVISEGTTEDDLMRFYERAFDRPLSPVDLSELKRQFDLFKDEFDVQLHRCVPEHSWR